MLIEERCPHEGITLALRSILGEEPLTVRVGGELGGIDRQLLAVVGKLASE
jgi:hypothetical protein